MALEEEVLVGGNFPDKEAECSLPKPEVANSKLTEKKMKQTNKTKPTILVLATDF